MPKTPLGSRLMHAWNAFLNRSPTDAQAYPDLGIGTSYRSDRHTLRASNERSIIVSIFNRIAIDVASIPLQHVRLDEEGHYLETIQSGLNYALTVEANIDQSSADFMRDLVMSLFDEGVVAIVPVDTTLNPKLTGAYDIQTMRVAKILEWYPQHVRVRCYNDKTGLQEELSLPKTMVAIIENPLYAVMNEPNSTLKRLIRKLNILDSIDEASGSGKLDLIIQLPYIIKSETRRLQAEQRRKQIEDQLAGSKYGIAYTDGTERITQLNRPAENNLMAQITYLTSMLYSQLGITEAVFNGTADEATMLNYQNRTVLVVVAAIRDGILRKFLTKTARAQKQTIMYFRDPFRYAPLNEIAEIADSFTRNEILSSNDVRGAIGFKPSNDPKADELRNKNLNSAQDESMGIMEEPPEDGEISQEYPEEINNLFEQFFADLEKDINALLPEEE